VAIASELATITASMADKPEAVAIHHLRNLRDAGLISKSGRGPSAAQMEIKDAALLLLAMAGTERLKDSVVTATTLGNLRAESFKQIWQRKQYRTRRAIFPLGEKHTLLEFLGCAFASSAIELGIRVEDQDASDLIYLIRSLQRTYPKPARFSFDILYPIFGAILEIEIPNLVRETWYFGRPSRKAGKEGEFTRSCRFGSPTLDEINKVLSQP
jgi:hypothetical protein